MKRDEDGRKWAAPYLHRPVAPAVVGSDTPTCPDHPQARMRRILGARWICPRCVKRND
jgi:hypothetical protein